MALLPELAVQSTFVGAGLQFGFILYLQQAQKYQYDVSQLVDIIAAGPMLVTAAASLVTALLLSVIKNRSRVEQFRQPTLLLVAAFVFTLSGVPYLFPDYLMLHVIATYASAVAHGITYIAGLSFVNIRVPSRARSSRIALCHFCYLLGLAIAAQILCQPTGWMHDYGVALLMAGAFSMVLLIVNEVFQFFKVYDYRCCLDADLQRVNMERVLLYDRKEIVDTLRANAAQFPDQVMVVSEVKRRWKLTGVLVLLRLHGFMLLVPTLRDHLQAVMDAQQFWLVHWSAVASVAIAVLLFLFFSAKMVYMLAAVLTSMALFVTIFLPPVCFGRFVPVLMYYAFLAVLYPIGDIAIVDTSEFAKTESKLCQGFLLEKLLLAIVLFVRFYAPEAVVSVLETRDTWMAYAISFLLCNVLLLVLVLYIYTNTHGKSLYRIRKEMMGIRMEKRKTVEELEQEQPTVLPPVPYGYNSATGTYNFPKKATTPTSPLAMPVWNNPQAAGGGGGVSPTSQSRPALARPRMAPAGAPPTTVFFTGGLDNRYERDLQRMSPASVMPRALVGGAIFSSIAWSM